MVERKIAEGKIGAVAQVLRLIEQVDRDHGVRVEESRGSRRPSSGRLRRPPSPASREKGGAGVSDGISRT
jgi:hypothetical protein